MNKVILIGRLTKDPDLKFAAGKGTAVCKFSIAVKREFKKEGQPDSDFINCIAFGKTAETIASYMVKGKQIAIVGSIQTGSYDAKDGTKRYTTDILVNSFEFIGSKEGGNNTGNTKNKSSDDFEPVDDMGDVPF